MNTVSLNQQRGQAMTEFVVAAAFVMVPLFIIVPTVGKYIDMKQSTIQAARYASWEYTANYVSLNDQPDGFPSNRTHSRSNIPKKNQSDVINEAKQRFFSNTSSPLNSIADRGGYDETNKNPLLTYHDGSSMYQGDSDTLNLKGSEPTPEIGNFRPVGTAIGIIGTVTGFVGDLLQAFGLNLGFDAINPDRDASVDGLFTSEFSLAVEPAPNYSMAFRGGNTAPLFGAPLDLKMEAKTGILTESWGAGGTDHTVFQAGGLIPTALLSGGVMDTALTIMSYIAPELGHLEFGYPVGYPELMDQVPAGHASDNKAQAAIKNDDRVVECFGGKCEQY